MTHGCRAPTNRSKPDAESFGSRYRLKSLGFIMQEAMADFSPVAAGSSKFTLAAASDGWGRQRVGAKAVRGEGLER